MSKIRDSNKTFDSQVECNLSQGARLAQLQRIEELNGQIGDIPTPPWLGQRLLDTQANGLHESHQAAYPIPNPGLATLRDAGLGSISRRTIITNKAFPGVNFPDRDTLYKTTDQDVNGWYHDDPFPLNHEKSAIFMNDSLHDHATAAALDVSDNTSQSPLQRLASTPSKTSRLSSNTSEDTPDIDVEVEDCIIVEKPAGKASPTSTLSSQLSPIKSNTPIVAPTSTEKVPAKRRRKDTKPRKARSSDLRPRTSIPSNIPHEELARQSVEAALSSRLNPFALHELEYDLLRRHICREHVTAYLNIRNRILRLWVRNPLLGVTLEEAAGCAYSSRWLSLAKVAYEWLLRNGYINFGCVAIQDTSNSRVKKSKTLDPAKRIVIIGAGMAGLGCARQLESLISYYREKWTSIGEEPPVVFVLEGRNRIGGRIYSHPLKKQDSHGIPDNLRCTAEMGAHIITGFDHGNPLNMIIRGQLALHYYPLKDNSSLYDIDGQIVDRDRDKMVEKLFNDILDRASVYRHKVSHPSIIEGDRSMIEAGRDAAGDAGKKLYEVEDENQKEARKVKDQSYEQVPAGLDKLTGKAHMVSGSRNKASPAMAAEAMGWKLASSVLARQEFNLDKVVKSMDNPTLGAAMDEGVKQYQYLLDLSPQDLRLLNWHFANLEYANAANVANLSLSSWDQDIGNEFEGQHAQVIGGYQQVPRGLLHYPSKLNLMTRKVVTRIEYDTMHSVDWESNFCASVECEDGSRIGAARIVLTIPLGVLKERSIKFVPELEGSKLQAIDRLGYGILNKVILVFKEPFWDVDQDMIGLLRDSDICNSLNQQDYIPDRGRFYLFWNCIKTSGLPLLIALMAGDAAHKAEALSDDEIVSEVTIQLARMFKREDIPKPLETIVTRWGKDRFARGTYSYVAPTAQSNDYDAMAEPLGNLHFAGEATCGTHPATVHGAYISGLRAASEVIYSMLGPIEVPDPLVPPAPVRQEPESVPTTKEVNHTATSSVESPKSRQARLQSVESEILKAIFAKVGPRPDKPGRSGSNPFLLFSKDHWGTCKLKCDAARQAALNSPTARASRNEIRTALGQLWRESSSEIKKPYIDQTISNRAVNHESAATFQDRLAEWDAEAMSIRRDWVKEHPGVLSLEEEKNMWQELGVYGATERRAKKLSGYADGSGDEMNVS